MLTRLPRILYCSPHARLWKNIAILGGDNKLNMSTSAVPDETAEDVIFHKIGSVRHVVLNRPKVLNSLNLSMIHKMYRKMAQWENDDRNLTRLVIVKSAEISANEIPAGKKKPARSFCAGGDVRSICEAGLENKQNANAQNTLPVEFFRDEYKLNYLIAKYSIPYVAFIDGITMGGGVGISVHGMFRVATERTVFAMPETAIGFFPDVGGSYFLPMLRGKLGTFLGLTGYRLTGRDVLHAGIATHYVPSDKLVELQQELETMNPNKIDKRSVDNVITKYTLGHKQEQTEFCLKPFVDKIDSIFSAESIEEIFANLEKDNSEWSLQQLSTLQKMSPTSLKVTLKELLLGSRIRNIKQCLQMEYRMTQHFMQENDFFAGVSAVLIDKTNKPTWKPASLQELSAVQVDAYFAKLPEEKELVL